MSLAPWGNLHLICFVRLLFTVDTHSLVLQCDCKDLVKVFTKANMTAQDKHVEDLVSEVTFGKVEHILQVNIVSEGWLKSGLPPRYFQIYHVLTHFELRKYANKRIRGKIAA